MDHTKYFTDTIINTFVGILLSVGILYTANCLLYSKEDRLDNRRVMELGVWTFILGALVWAVYRKYMTSQIDTVPGML